MPEINVEVEIYCSCGNGLCNQSVGGIGRRGIPFITVEPCEKCLEKARREGYDEGYSEYEKEKEKDNE